MHADTFGASSDARGSGLGVAAAVAAATAFYPALPDLHLKALVRAGTLSLPGLTVCALSMLLWCAQDVLKTSGPAGPSLCLPTPACTMLHRRSLDFLNNGIVIVESMLQKVPGLCCSMQFLT